jgi:HK97 family phage prohead protease
MSNTFCLSDSRNVNSHGFRLSLDGLDLTRFAANPIMLYQHDTERIIGKWDNLRVEDGRLLADPDFDTEDEEAKKVAEKVERGYLKGCSIGIIVREMTEAEDGCHLATSAELLEASIVSIPADAGAVRLFDEERRELTAEAIPTYLSATTKHTPMDETRTIDANPVEQLAALQTQFDAKVAEVAELAAKVAELTDKRAEQDAIITDLSAKIAEMEKQATADYLAAAVKEGRITSDESKHFARLAEFDEEAVRSIIDARPAKPSASLAAQIKDSGARNGERANWTLIDWLRNDNSGLQKMKHENPEEFERLKGDTNL